MTKASTGIKASDIKFSRYRFDVVVIGAGGAGLRAAVEARQALQNGFFFGDDVASFVIKS